LSDLDFHHFLLLALRVALAVGILILLTGIVDGLALARAGTGEIGLIVATPGLALFIAGSAITESGLALSVW
jgi:hypothetical protein